jgi:hypothetical protein
MIRNLKTLGLALFALLALGAVAASAASAQVAEQGELTSDGPVTLTGKNTPETVNAFTAFGNSTKCPNALYTGHKYNVTPHEGIPSGSTTSTITPHYGACTSTVFNFPTTVDMNGCDYVFHLETTTPAGNKEKTYGVTATIVNCPAGKHIQVTVFTSGSAHGAGTNPFCTVTITENALGYKGLHATDLGTGKIKIHGTIVGIEADQDRGPHPLPFGIPCAEAETKEGELHLDITVSGHNPAKPKTETTISISEVVH